MPDDLFSTITQCVTSIANFTLHAGDLKLRRYQSTPARAIVLSCLHQQGHSFVVLFPRQSGKNELQAQIEAYLLTVLSQDQAEMVKISPTFKPQTLNAMRRLQRVLESNKLTRTIWTKESGYIYRIGSARVFFFTGSPESNIVGATANTLLSIDEAQDIEIDKYDKDIAPMAASTNATRVFWGTAWTNRTLLARELRAASESQKLDGIQRVFRITADDVSKEVPAYGSFVEEQVRRLGRQNPMVKSQFFSEEIGAEGGLFPPQRAALMQGAHPPQDAPLPGHTYAFLIDVGGEEVGAGSEPTQGRRDSTALTIVEVNRVTLDDPLIKAPTYQVVQRRTWTGASMTSQYAQLKALADTWQPHAIVIDATGIGAGLASFLGKAFTHRVIPFTFNSATKSSLGWSFLSIIDTGRFKDFDSTLCRMCNQRQIALQTLFFLQLSFTAYDIQTGPDHKIKWSVPEGTRNPTDGCLVHDDLVLSAALVSALEDQPWNATGDVLLIPGIDPLEELSHGF